MNARGWQVVLGVLVASAVAHADDPKPQAIDIKPFKDKLQIYVDAKGGTYAVLHEPDQVKRVFYGASAKTLYAQIIIGGGADGDAWNISTWAPRVRELRPGSISRLHDGTVMKQCDGLDEAALTLLTGDKAKAVIDKAQFMSPAMMRHAYLLARDDNGVYYYVDAIRGGGEDYHGRVHRGIVGRKGAMKQMPLTDMASDSAGDVFSTKTGSLRLVRNRDSEKITTMWVKGDKRSELVWLDLDVNSHLIYSDLGIYTFLGTICDGL